MDYNEIVDIPSAKERFMNNETLYKKFLFRVPTSTLMEELEQHLSENNLDGAFRDAHSLKGMVGNLSLYKLMSIASTVTEKLRVSEVPDEADMDALRAAYRDAVYAINVIQEQDIKLF